MICLGYNDNRYLKGLRTKEIMTLLRLIKGGITIWNNVHVNKVKLIPNTESEPNNRHLTVETYLK